VDEKGQVVRRRTHLSKQKGEKGKGEKKKRKKSRKVKKAKEGESLLQKNSEKKVLARLGEPCMNQRPQSVGSDHYGDLANFRAFEKRGGGGNRTKPPGKSEKTLISKKTPVEKPATLLETSRAA